MMAFMMMFAGDGPLQPVFGVKIAREMSPYEGRHERFNTLCLTKTMQAFHEGMRPGRFEPHGLDT